MLKEDRTLVWAAVIVAAVIAVEIVTPSFFSLFAPEPCQLTNPENRDAANQGQSGQTPPIGQPIQAAPNQRNAGEKKNECNTNTLIAAYTRQVANYTGLLVLATVILGIFGAVQAWLTRQEINLARDEFNATHRPQLEVRFVRGVPDGIEITVINAGTSDAIFVAARGIIFHLSIGTALPSPHEIVTGDFALRRKFEPSQSDTHTITVVADEFAAGFGDPRYIFGWIIYDTSAPKPVRRTTYFGRMQVPLQNEFISVERSDWNFIQ